MYERLNNQLKPICACLLRANTSERVATWLAEAGRLSAEN